jgi:hypothetical protein
MNRAQLNRLEYLDAVEFPTPEEYAELRALWALRSALGPSA